MRAHRYHSVVRTSTPQSAIYKLAAVTYGLNLCANLGGGSALLGPLVQLWLTDPMRRSLCIDLITLRHAVPAALYRPPYTFIEAKFALVESSRDGPPGRSVRAVH